MIREKRRAGRAIRKQRREQRELLAEMGAIDWAELFEQFAGAMVEIVRVFAVAVDNVARFYVGVVEAYRESAEREFRMTYRALTTGRGEVC